MKYYTAKTVSGKDFQSIRTEVEAALKEVGFGILTEIDLKAIMKKKLNKEYRPHVILGACSPVYADKVLSVDPRISTLLPCNVTIRELESGDIEVAAMDPSAAMSVVENQQLEEYAAEVQKKLKSVVESL